MIFWINLGQTRLTHSIWDLDHSISILKGKIKEKINKPACLG
jgi:hypothetical protein